MALTRKALSFDTSPKPDAGRREGKQDGTDADQTHRLASYVDEPSEKGHAGHGCCRGNSRVERHDPPYHVGGRDFLDNSPGNRCPGSQPHADQYYEQGCHRDVRSPDQPAQSYSTYGARPRDNRYPAPKIPLGEPYETKGDDE